MPALLVICLCARWCDTCSAYQVIFEQLAQTFTALRFVWVDVEDQADWVDAIDVENFPTLLLAQQGRPVFFGPVLPHRATLQRLIEVYLSARQPAISSEPLTALAQRFSYTPRN